MQEQKAGIFSYMARFLVIYAITILIVAVMGVIGGDESQAYSDMYKLGSAGIGYDTLFQLGLVDLIVTLFNIIFFSDKLFGKMMVMWRTILMMICIIILMVISIIAFRWFPLDFAPGWIGFIISFGICFAGSTVISIIKTKSDTKKYGELLERYKQTLEAEDEDTDSEAE
ncbi:MAG: hypothetical protein Q4G60_13600 [bacterium]|nr:hypothetical protein [bacterium]